MTLGAMTLHGTAAHGMEATLEKPAWQAHTPEQRYVVWISVGAE